MAEELSTVASLLAGAPAPPQETEETTVQDAVETPPAIEAEPAEDTGQTVEAEAEVPIKPLTVKSLAEKLGIRPQDIYGSLQIDVGGTSVTLSELKDRGKDLHKADELLATAEERKTAVDNELMRTRRELAVAAEGIQVTPAHKQAAEDRWASYVGAQNDLTLKAIPEWIDPAVQRADLTAVGEMLAGTYGFAQAEINAFADHRMVKLFQDFAKLQARLKAATDSEVKVTRRQSSKSRRRRAVKPANAAVDAFKAGTASQESAVVALIAEGIDK